MNRILVGVVIAACGAWAAATAGQAGDCRAQCTATIVTNGGVLQLTDASQPFHSVHGQLRLTIQNNTGGALTVRVMNFQFSPGGGPMVPRCPGGVTPAELHSQKPCDSAGRKVNAHGNFTFVVNTSHANVNDHYKFDVVAGPANGTPTTFDPELIVDP